MMISNNFRRFPLSKDNRCWWSKSYGIWPWEARLFQISQVEHSGWQTVVMINGDLLKRIPTGTKEVSATGTNERCREKIGSLWNRNMMKGYQFQRVSDNCIYMDESWRCMPSPVLGKKKNSFLWKYMMMVLLKYILFCLPLLWQIWPTSQQSIEHSWVNLGHTGAAATPCRHILRSVYWHLIAESTAEETCRKVPFQGASFYEGNLGLQWFSLLKVMD